nr:LPO_1073/Vpar_1526 family protein [Demequina gelatinilytica]
MLAEYADESTRVIQERITKLDDRIIASLIREGRLEVFADPGFLRSYKRAQEGAAVSEHDSDYDLLSGLLVDRAARGTIRTVRTGIEKAIEIVDSVDDEALRGLTVFQALQQYSPLAQTLDAGLDAMDALMGDLVDGPLPEGIEWLDHLDVLDAIRLSQVSSLKPFREYYPNRMPGYLARGVLAEGFDWPFTHGGKEYIDPRLMVQHELKPDYLRFAVAQAQTLDAMGIPSDVADGLASQAKRFGFGNVDKSLVEPFLERLRLRPNLAQIEQWWGQIPHAVQVTAVGRVLARANALRLDKRGVLPPID